MIKNSRHVVAAMLALPATSFALGVGDIEWQSKLNEPLRATIELIYGDSEEAQSATAQLATAEDFARVGLDRSQVDVPLSFEVQRNDQGNFVIVVTSDESVEEPFLNFLVEVEWENGRLLREYVVLLDPPVTAPASNVVDVTPIPDEPPQREELPATASETRDTGTGQTSSQQPASTTPRFAGDEEYGPVSRGETLWEIARDTRPSSEITVNQMMVMFLELNPEAFYEQNVNALREGAILRIPDSSDISAMPATTANARVEEFNELWNVYAQQARLAQVPTVSDAGIDSQYTADEPTRRPDRDDSRLELVPPAGTSDTSRDQPGAGGATADSLRSDLARTREDLITARQENRELLDRVTELEDLIDSYEQTIDLKDANFAELQQQLREARENAGLAASVDSPTTDPFATPESGMQDDGVMDDSMTEATESQTSTDPFAIDDSPADDESMMADDSDGSASDDPFGRDTTVDTTEDSVADTSSDDVDAQDAVEPTVQREPKGLDKKFIGMIALLVTLLAAGGLGFFVWRKRKANADEEGSGFELIDDDDELEPDLDAAGAEVEDDLDERETQLREALAADPSDPQNHLALLRRHYAANDEDRFIAAAERMRDSVGDDHPAWMEVRAMGANIAPGAAVFGDAGDDSSMESTRMLDRTSEEELDLRLRPTADEDTDLDIDLDLGEDDDLDMGGADAADTSLDDDLDLDLDLGDDDSSAAGEPQTDEFSLDLDLDEDAVDDDDLDLDLDFGDDEPASGGSDDDLDLDLDLDLDGPADEPGATSDDDGLDLDLDFGDDSDDESASSKDEDDLGLDLDDLSLDGESDTQDDHTEFELEALDTEDSADKDTAELSLDDLGDLDDLDLDDKDSGPATTDNDLSLDLGDDGDDLSLDDLDLGDDAGGDDDAVATKLDLAKAYIEMGDPDGAKGMLEEVLAEGNDGQKAEAQGLLDDL